MRKLKIAVAVDENYIYPLKVMLYSLFMTNKEAITVFLIHTRVSEKKIMEIKTLCISHRAEFRELRLENDIFQSAPVSRYFTKETYYRLLLPWLLPQEDRVLYLDPDIIINGSLKELWNIELHEAVMAGVRDRIVMLLGTKIASELKNDTIYINGGVLLMNLKQIRKVSSPEKIMSVISEREKDLELQDQDLINLMWEGQILLVDDIFNLNPNFLYLKEYLSMPFRKNSWKIIHYMGVEKPWNKGYMGSGYLLWAKAEWHVYPNNRGQILGKIVLDPVRYIYGLYKFIKNHKQGKSN